MLSVTDSFQSLDAIVFAPGSNSARATENEKKVTVVRRGGYAYVLEPTEPISGCTLPQTEYEILQDVLACAPRVDLICGKTTRHDLASLPDNRFIEAIVQLKPGANCQEIEDILRACFQGDKKFLSFIDLADDAIGLYLNVPTFLKLCSVESVKKVSSRAIETGGGQ